MNFFEQQDRAHRNTRYLILLLSLAVISLIAITTLLLAVTYYYWQLKNNHNLPQTTLWQGLVQSINGTLISEICIGVFAVIFFGSLYKFIQFSSGGRAVAEAMGGHLLNSDTNDADERKILNVVEEMAIASGTSVPLVYLLEDDTINAFAAGHTPQNAVIGITRGCIHLLTRDELQGVIAHEFSHIFHGDMNLNMRLVALLNGILLLGLIGQFLVRSPSHHHGHHSNRSKSSLPIFAMGIGLIVIGYAGTFFGSLIKAAVSRQREFLADASAVKFTRNPEGIAGALKKIGGNTTGSQLHNSHAAEFSHMYFSQGIGISFLQLMATHPPLEDRIKRIEPHWDGDFLRCAASPVETMTDAYAGISSLHSQQQAPDTTIEFTADIDHAIASIGRPSQQHIAYAQQTLANIDVSIQQAARNPWEAQALMFGLLLDNHPQQQEQQWLLLAKIFTTEQISSLTPWALVAFNLTPSLRLPLLELSLPALKQLSANQYKTFKQALTRLIHADQQINLIEWCYFRILTHNLENKITHSRLLSLPQLVQESITLLSVIAHVGAENQVDMQAAFDSGKTSLGLDNAIMLDQSAYTMLDVEIAITRLNNLKPLQKPRLLKAISQCILHDKIITINEAELFRAIADGLNCPIPPLLINRNE